MRGRWAPPTRLTLWASALAVAITIATGAYLASVYSSLPFGVPVQYVAGRPYIFQVKTPIVVMLPAVVQGALLAVFGSLMLLLLWRARPAAEETAPQIAADRRRMSLAAEGIAVLAAIWITVQALGALRLIVLWRGAWGGFGRVYSLAMFAAIAGSGVVVIRTMQRVGRQRRDAQPDDPSVWRLRHLYVNRADPALFVPTRTGASWTLNFGRPLAIALLGATLILGIGGPFMFARYVLRGFTLGLTGP